MEFRSRSEWIDQPPTKTDPILSENSVTWHAAAQLARPPAEQQLKAIFDYYCGFTKDMPPGGAYWDIPYNFAICSDGDIWECRGWDVKGAGNGVGNNDDGISVLVLALCGQPLPAAVPQAMMTFWRTAHGRGYKENKLHCDWRPTECPGIHVAAVFALACRDASYGKGARGEHIKALQRFLEKAGYAPGPIDGIIGRGKSKTTMALQSFLIDKGFSVGSDGADGHWGGKTRSAFDRARNAGYFSGLRLG
jgi:hypothetical protein